MNKKDPLIRRIQSATGHLQAIARMVDAGVPCGEVLHQLAAVRAALRAIKGLLIEEQLEDNMIVISQSSSSQERTRAAEQLAALYQMISK